MEGEALTETPEPEDKPRVGVQLNKVAVPDVNKLVAFTPKQILAAEAESESVGNGLTTTVCETDAVQALAAVTVTGYTPACVKDTEGIESKEAKEEKPPGPDHT